VLAPATSTSAPGLPVNTLFSVTSSCPGTTKILGGGGSYSVAPIGQYNRVALVRSYPSAANAWTVTIRVNAALGPLATITASVYAICTV
jgi:hypothetical protein